MIASEVSESTALLSRLSSAIADLGSVVVALSGGVDSSVVAAVAARVLGSKAVAVTGVSPSLSPRELDDIKQWCLRIGIEHVTVETHEMRDPAYVQNSPQRCYHCKHELYARLSEVRAARLMAHIVDGTNADDATGHRPGMRAARDAGVVSPLHEGGFSKRDVRALASHLGLPNATRPSSPCLSSRLAYGVSVTPERLTRVAKAEAFIQSLGFSQVRVRLHDAIARIEVPADSLQAFCRHAPEVVRQLKSFGFHYVTLDLQGFRSGSLLEIIDPAVVNMGRA